jgi:hypothetical protein
MVAYTSAAGTFTVAGLPIYLDDGTLVAVVLEPDYEDAVENAIIAKAQGESNG